VEDRGVAHFVWRMTYSDGVTFTPPRADEPIVISVPIGWGLRPDPQEGVVLESTFRERVTATTALKWAEAGTNGFRQR
jgi:hypothetical protein